MNNEAANKSTEVTTEVKGIKAIMAGWVKASQEEGERIRKNGMKK